MKNEIALFFLIRIDEKSKRVKVLEEILSFIRSTAMLERSRPTFRHKSLLCNLDHCSLPQGVAKSNFQFVSIFECLFHFIAGSYIFFYIADFVIIPISHLAWSVVYRSWTELPFTAPETFLQQQNTHLPCSICFPLLTLTPERKS